MKAGAAEGGVVNEGFVADEKKASDEEAALAAVDAAVEAEEADKTESLHLNNNNTTVVVADVTPEPTYAVPEFTPSPESDEPPKTQEETVVSSTADESMLPFPTAMQFTSAAPPPSQQDDGELSTEASAQSDTGDSTSQDQRL